MALCDGTRFRKATSKFAINKETLLAKLVYAFAFSCYGSIESFNTTFLHDVGLSPKQAGIVSGARAITIVLGNTSITMLADKTKGHRVFILLIGAIVISTLLPMPWLARYICHATKCKPCLLASNESLSDVEHYVGCQNQVQSEQQVLFIAMLTLNLVGAFFYGPVAGLADSAAMQCVKSSQVPTNIGQQLRFASLGWAIGPAVVGTLGEYGSFGDLSSYTSLFLVYSVCMCGTCLSLFGLYTRMNRHKQKAPQSGNHDVELVVSEATFKSGNAGTGNGIFKSLIRTLNSKHAVFVYLAILALATNVGLQGATLLIFMLDLGASGLNQGLSVLSEVGTEFFFYSLVIWAIEKVGGHMRALAASSFLFFVRALLISFLHNPWFLLPILSLTSLFQPLMYTSMLQLTSQIFPPGLETTMYGFSDSVVTTGIMIGSMVGGTILQLYGGRTLYRVTAVHMAFWFFVIIVYDRFYRRSKVFTSETQPLLKHEQKVDANYSTQKDVSVVNS